MIILFEEGTQMEWCERIAKIPFQASKKEHEVCENLAHLLDKFKITKPDHED